MGNFTDPYCRVSLAKYKIIVNIYSNELFQSNEIDHGTKLTAILA